MNFKRSEGARVGIVVLLVVLGGAIGWPLVSILGDAFVTEGGFTTDVIAEAFQTPGVREALLNSAYVIIPSSIMATVGGCALAVVATKIGGRRQRFLRVVPLVPLTVAPLVGAIGWVFLLAPRTGWINIGIRAIIGGEDGPFNIFSVPGVIWVTTLYVIPYVFVTVSAALDRTSSDTFEAYRINGSTAWGAAIRVVSGVLRPALSAAFILSVIQSIIQFSIPLILDVNVLTTAIYRLIRHAFPVRRDLAAALALLLLLLGTGLTLLEMYVLRRRSFTAISGRGVSSQRWTFGRRQDRLLVRLAYGYLGVAALLPFMAISLVSLLPYWKPRFLLSDLTTQNFVSIFESRNFMSALKNSLTLTLFGCIAAVALALTVSLIRKRSRSAAAGSLFAVANAPLGIPGIVLGLGILIVATSGPFPLYGSLLAIGIAYVLQFLPLGLRNLDPVVRQSGTELEEASRVSGAGPVRVLADVTLPMALPGITAAAAIVSILMFREFPMSALLSAPTTQVVSVYLVNGFQTGVFSQVAAMAVGLSMVSLLGVVGLQSANQLVKFQRKSKSSSASVDGNKEPQVV